MTRILVVEDNEDLAYGLSSNLELEGYEVAIAVNGTDGLARAVELRPDLVLLDLMLPGMDGYDVLSSMREQGVTARVLILTARGEEMDKVRGLRLGADDYLTKPFGLMELLARVEALLRRDRNGPAAGPGDRLYRLADLQICTATRRVTCNGNDVGLAPREFELLVELVRNNGAVVSRIDLMRRVWGHSGAVVSRTVDTHVAELRRKLEKDPSHPRLILTVRKAGYRIAVPVDRDR